MAITQQAIYADLVESRAVGNFPFQGLPFDQLAQAIAVSVVSWGVGRSYNLGLTGVTSGGTGSGRIQPLSTRLFVLPNSALLIESLAAAGLEGPLGESLGKVVSQAISTTFSTVGRYTGSSTGVGSGVDVSKVTVSNPASLTVILIENLSAAFDGGPAAPMMAAGLGVGIANLLLAGTGTGSVVGSAGLPQKVGISQSSVV